MKLRHVLYGSIPLLLVILGVMYPISGFKDLSSSLVAWGTLMLAIATFTLIKTSKDQENQRRQDELAKEMRDRKERLLNEIIEWAIDMTRCEVPLDPAFTRIEDSEQSRRLIHVLISNEEVNVKARWGKGQYVLTAILPDWLELREAVEGLYNDAGNLLELLRKSRDAVNANKLDEFSQANIEISNQKRKMLDSVTEVIGQAVIIKSTLLNS